MKTLTFILALLLTLNSYCYFDTLNPVLFIYDSEVLNQQTKIYSQLWLDIDTGKYILVLDSMPKTIDPLSIEFKNNENLQIHQVQSILKKRNNQSIKGVYDKIIYLKELLSEIDIEKTRLENQEKFIQAESLKKLRGTSNTERIKIIEESNQQIQELREYAKLEAIKHQNLQNEISFLLANAQRKSHDPYQRIYLMIESIVPLSGNLELNYIIHHSESDLLEGTPNNNQQIVGFWLSGKVYDPKSGEFLIRANVHLSFKGNTIAVLNTDHEGYFNIQLKEVGPYEVIVTQENYKTKRLRSIFLVENEINHWDIALRQINPVNAIEIMTLAIPIIEVMKDF